MNVKVSNLSAEMESQSGLPVSSRFSTAYLPWIICGLGALFYSYEYLLRISPGVMVGELMRHYQINAATFGFVTALYYYAYTPMQLVVGLLMDRYGPRKLLTIACAFCVVGSFLFGGVSVLSLASFGRFLVGLGSAFAFVGVLKLATIWLPPNRLALISGLAAALGTLGALFGTVFLTDLAERFGWQHTVYLSGFFGIVLTVVLWWVIRDRVNFRDKESASAAIESRVDFKQAFHDLSLILRTPQIWLNGTVSCLLYLPTTVFAELWGHHFLKHVFNYSPKLAAYGIAVLFLGFTIGAPLSGFLSDTIRLRRLPIIIGALGSTLLFSIFVFDVALPRSLVFIMLFMIGLLYSTHVISFALGRELSPPEASGSAIAVTNMIIMLGGFICQPFVGVLLDMRATGRVYAGVPEYFASDYRYALSVIPIGMLLSAILACFLKETHCQLIVSSENNSER